MRRFLNSPEGFVADYLRGLGRAHADIIEVDPELQVVSRRHPLTPGKVGVVSGGGSGCEPLHSGFVGVGALDAACVGPVFSSPVPDQILHVTQLADAGAGVLHIVTNYPGEIMNFEMAAELAEDDQDTKVLSVIVGDDVAVPEGPDSAGRRGLGATIAVSRIAGAAAECGQDLQRVADVASSVAARSRSYGVGLTSCTPPHRTNPIFDLPDDQLELGIGISGEPGRERAATRTSRELATLMVSRVMDDLRPRTNRPLLAMLSGMGSTPWGELHLLYGDVTDALQEAGVQPARNHVGNTITSLDQFGAALTLVELDEDLLQLWDAPIHTAAMRWGV